MTVLADAAARKRALTELDETLLVEAAAGTGKTAIIAGRVTMLLASGVAPSAIAAVTFTEFAASELAARVGFYLDELLSDRIPDELALALPNGMSTQQKAALRGAARSIDELTATTVHAFCQTLITTHAIDAGIDPGARVLEGQGKDAAYDIVFDEWLERRLSGPRPEHDPIAFLAKQDPRGVAPMLREVARLLLNHPGSSAPEPDWRARPDLSFAQHVTDLRAWYGGGQAEAETAKVIAQLETLAQFFQACCAERQPFPALWRLAHPERLPLMEWKTKDLKLPKLKRAWIDAAGKEAGLQRFAQLEQRFAQIADNYRRLLGHIAGAVMFDLASELEEVRAAYADYKRCGALMDFDDLQILARNLVRDHEGVRRAIAKRFQFVLVDEFQDTDPLQAEIFFRLGAAEAVDRWQDAVLRPGALFMVGDPKQAIYAFRGADIGTYDMAKSAIRARWPQNFVNVTANFRSRPGIISYVNGCFAEPLDAHGQPGYVALEPTRADAGNGMPAAAKLTVATHAEASAEQLRRAEAAAVADLCARLIGNLEFGGRKLRPGDIALLAAQPTELWLYEAALTDRGLSFVSQAGKGLFRRQETRDMLALVRALADRSDSVAFGALMRGPLVGLSEEELLDIAEPLPDEPKRARFSLFTEPEGVAHPRARRTLQTLRELSARARITTPFLLLSEALERLNVRAILAQRGEERGARAWANVELVLERARPYSVGGLKRFARDLHRAWGACKNTEEGRLDAEGEAIELLTMFKAKGLQWPVVIPINATSLPPQRTDHIHRPDDDTLHWIAGEVRSPELTAALAVDEEAKARERARVWYVACTRAEELLIVPRIQAAGVKSWARAVDLAFDQLPEWELERFKVRPLEEEQDEPNTQSEARFAEQQARIAEKSAPSRWRNPSVDDLDRALPVETLASAVDDAPEIAPVVGAGRLRGLVLHKLMEEVLTGETGDDAVSLAARAAALTAQLAAQAQGASNPPSAEEMASAVLRTLALPEVSAVRSKLQPELGLYAELAPNEMLAGRADAIAYESDRAEIVFDWKSDVAPSETAIEEHVNQLGAYLAVTAARRGALVYMTTGSVRWVNNVGA